MPKHYVHKPISKRSSAKIVDTSDNKNKPDTSGPVQFFVSIPYEYNPRNVEGRGDEVTRVETTKKFGKNTSPICEKSKLYIPELDSDEKIAERQRLKANREMLIKKYGEEFVNQGWNLADILTQRQNRQQAQLKLETEDFRLRELNKSAEPKPTNFSISSKGSRKIRMTSCLGNLTKSPATNYGTHAERHVIPWLIGNPSHPHIPIQLPMKRVKRNKKLPRDHKSVFDTGQPGIVCTSRLVKVLNEDGSFSHIEIKCEYSESVVKPDSHVGDGDTNLFAWTKGQGSEKDIARGLIVTAPAKLEYSKKREANRKLCRKYESNEELSDHPTTAPSVPAFLRKNKKPAWKTPPSSVESEESNEDPNWVYTFRYPRAKNVESLTKPTKPEVDINVEPDETKESENEDVESVQGSDGKKSQKLSEKSEASNSEKSENSDSETEEGRICYTKSINPELAKKSSKIERHIKIPENHNEFLEFFSAKNLSQHEISLHQDDPLTMNKFYMIDSENWYTDWNLNRNAIMDNLAEFVKLPVAIGFLIKCKIFRDRRGMDRGLFPAYTMHLENEKCKHTLLMTARKRKKTAASSYIISTNPLHLVRSNKNSIVGKVRGNIPGTEFTIFDGGLSPKKFLKGSGSPREELGAVNYEPNVFGFKGPRKIKVLLPGMVSETKRFARRPEGDHDTMLANCRTGLMHGIISLQNKTPVYNNEVRSFVLNFKGRVTQASVKNFQIIHPQKEDYTILQFGRISEDSFNLDIRFPLCPLQAFGIILSSFAGKLACE